MLKFNMPRERVGYLKSSEYAVVLGADVGATTEGGHGDGVPVQNWQVVAVPTVWESASIVVRISGIVAARIKGE